MKALAVIFAFYTLFLAVQPGIQSLLNPIDVTTKNCCGSSCEPVEKEHPDEDDQSACNPFQPCTVSGGFISDLISIQYLSNVSFVQTYIEYNDGVPLEIPLDFWQPPKIA